mmetsp:Transcript_22991/g.72176  ORF Transcript_22991/g.72176 Transcript_22991/m.72176 type:complete len:363 (-) Transcript_22991:14-1102(-)
MLGGFQAACLATVCLPLAAGLRAGAGGLTQPLRAELRASSSLPLKGLLAADGRVNGSWHMCAAPIAETKAGPKSEIPRILHQTYKTKALPDLFSYCRDSWMQETPDWKHRIWLDHEIRALVKVHYPWFLKTYDAFEHTIQRVDAARIFMLHRYGGVYADLDIEAVKDPAPLFNGDYDMIFFYQIPPHDSRTVVDNPRNQTGRPRLGTISNALMASKPGHPFWIFLAEMMAESREAALEEAAKSEIPNMDIYLTTGPSMMSRALSEYQTLHTDVKVAIYSKKYWSPFSWGNKEDPCEVRWECRALFPEAFLVSHWSRSWILCPKGSGRGKRLCAFSSSLLQQQVSVNWVDPFGSMPKADSWCL